MRYSLIFTENEVNFIKNLIISIPIKKLINMIKLIKKICERKHTWSNCVYRINLDLAATEIIINRGLVVVESVKFKF
ncbi:hypothetical protein AFK68_15610 [Hydrocoleum sp. CS-953]|nr:hypothetical protein AFK68_15610 [Hydrocoleum sp. CS-953]